MSRFIIAFVVIAAALTIYAVVDCAMTDARRTRALSKPVWLVVALLVPVIGPLLWILIGKGLLLSPQRSTAPDDDEAFLRSLNEQVAHDGRINQLEEELRSLDEQSAPSSREERPGEDEPGAAGSTRA